MDQDLSLMSQLLTLNDKIEEIKSRVKLQRQSECLGIKSWSVNEISDSETSDTDDSRIDFYNASTGSCITKSFKSLDSKDSDAKARITFKNVHRKITPEEDDIIHVKYRKKPRKARRRKCSISRQESASADDSSAFSDTDDDVIHSDTDSTLSGISDSSVESVLENATADDDENNDNEDDENTVSPEKPEEEEPLIPRVGGISHNQCFAKFLETNAGKTIDTKSTSQALTGHGHNIPLGKYYVPQGLVYLKLANAENVFCQFTS